jgi:hypothetical protein
MAHCVCVRYPECCTLGWGECAVFSLSVTSLYSLCIRLDLSVTFLSLFCSLSRPLWASLCPLCGFPVTFLHPLLTSLKLFCCHSVVFCSLSRPLWASLCSLCGSSVTILHPLWTSAAILWRSCTALSHSEPLRGRMLYKRSSRIAGKRHGTGESDG